MELEGEKMDKMDKIIKATIKANDEIKQFTEELLSQSEMFEAMNLKLHSIPYYIYTGMEDDFPNTYNDNRDYFEAFCDDSWLFFREWAKEEYIDLRDMMRYIRRTSSFHLSNNVANYFNTREGITEEVVIDAVSDYGNFCKIDNLIKGGEFEINKSAISEELADYICNEDDFLEDIKYELLQVPAVIKDIKNELEDIVKVYQYIKDFKDNQIEYFKEYISFYEEELEALKEEEQREEEARNEVLDNINSIITDDILTYGKYKFKINLT